MSDEKRCPVCTSELVEGVCPKCSQEAGVGKNDPPGNQTVFGSRPPGWGSTPSQGLRSPSRGFGSR